MQGKEKRIPFFYEERRLNNFLLANCLFLSELSGVCLCILDT